VRGDATTDDGSTLRLVGSLGELRDPVRVRLSDPESSPRPLRIKSSLFSHWDYSAAGRPASSVRVHCVPY